MNTRHFLACFLLTGLSLLPMWMHSGLPNGSDIPIHYWRAAELDHLWASGETIPRWSEHFFYGYGYPFFEYYGAGGYALAVLMGKLPLVDDVLRLRLMWAAGTLAASIGMFLYGQRRWGARAGLVSAAGFIFAPMLIFGEPIARGSLPVALAMGWLALSLGLLDRVAVTGRYRLPAALSIAALIYTHNVSAALGIAVLVGWLAWCSLWQRASMPNLRIAWLALALGIGLAGFFWLPLLMERDLVSLDRVYAGENLDYRNYFQLPGALFGLAHRFDSNLIGQPTTIPLGVASWLLGLVGLGWVFRQKNREMMYWASLALVAIFFVTPYSLPLWEVLPILRFLQFPTRLLSISAMGLAVLGGYTFSQIKNYRYADVVFAAVLILLTAQGLQSTPWNWTDEFPSEATPAAYFAYELQSNQRGTTGTNEFLPATVNIPPAPSDFLLESLRADGPARRISRDDLSIEGVTSGPTRYDFTVTSEQAAELEVFLFYFPGWRAWIDGERAPIGPVGDHGFIGLTIPAGTHRVELRFGDTRPRQVGLLMSALCAAVIGGLKVTSLTSRLKRRGGFASPRLQNHAQYDPLKNRDLLIVAAVTLLMTVLGVAYLREGIAWTASPRGEARLAEHPLRLRFGDSITLLGYDVEKQPHQLQVGLYWYFEADAAPDINAFVHVVDGSGQIIAQQDKANFSKVIGYPWWDESLHLRDLYIIETPNGLSQDYQIRIGLWRDDNVRLPIYTEDGDSLGEVFFLGR